MHRRSQNNLDAVIDKVIMILTRREKGKMLEKVSSWKRNWSFGKSELKEGRAIKKTIGGRSWRVLCLFLSRPIWPPSCLLHPSPCISRNTEIQHSLPFFLSFEIPFALGYGGSRAFGLINYSFVHSVLIEVASQVVKEFHSTVQIQDTLVLRWY